jgi:glycosyltransferase involved in cell wall biosynthesis
LAKNDSLRAITGERQVNEPAVSGMVTSGKISIIMPCYNAEAHLPKSVASALTQTYEDIELIVVDDGSADRSLEILREIGDPRLRIISQTNKGVSSARNRGLGQARGCYIAFLDADDTWHPHFLEALYKRLHSEPEAALAYCGWQNVGLSGGPGNPYIPPDYEKEGKVDHLLRTCPWPIHAVLTLRNAVENAGGFDERLAHAEDYKLWLRVALFNKIVRVDKVLAFYHFHGKQQATRNRSQSARDHWLVQQEFLREHPEIFQQLGSYRVRQLTYGELLRRGYISYWERDLETARQIFRIVMKSGYGTPRDWKYMLPALLPLSLHHALIRIMERSKEVSA